MPNPTYIFSSSILRSNVLKKIRYTNSHQSPLPSQTLQQQLVLCGARHMYHSSKRNRQSARRLISDTKNIFLSTVAIRFSKTVSSNSDENTTTGGDTATTDTTEEILDPKTAGEDFYQRYLTVWNELEKFIEEQERIKSEKMFQAWQSAQPQPLPETIVDNESTKNVPTTATGTATTTSTRTTTTASNNKNAGGVAVVRTLASEVSKLRETDPVQKLEKRALNLLQIAAIKYKHPMALVEFANLELGKKCQEAMLSLEKKNDLVITDAWIRDNIEPCLLYYEMAGDAGVSAGFYNLAHIYWDGSLGIIEADRHRAMHYMQRAIHLGDVDAMYFVGAHRLNRREDFRVDQLQKALMWVEKAADQHHGGALHFLTVMYMRGCTELDIPPCSDDEFQRRLSLAIEYDDNGDAHWIRSNSYGEGSHGYQVDIHLWLNDLVKAAELGHATACLNAGVTFFQGFPGKIETDKERAFQYYQRAGELGNMEGWRNVVDCYATGQGVKQNVNMAKYIGETMIRPYDEELQKKGSTPDSDDAFEETDDEGVDTSNNDKQENEYKVKID